MCVAIHCECVNYRPSTVNICLVVQRHIVSYLERDVALLVLSSIVASQKPDMVMHSLTLREQEDQKLLVIPYREGLRPTLRYIHGNLSQKISHSARQPWWLLRRLKHKRILSSLASKTLFQKCGYSWPICSHQTRREG